MTLIVKFFEHAIRMPFALPIDLLYLAAGIALIGLSLYLSHAADKPQHSWPASLITKHKTASFAEGGVATPRRSDGYDSSSRLALRQNPSVLFVPPFTKQTTSPLYHRPAHAVRPTRPHSLPAAAHRSCCPRRDPIPPPGEMRRAVRAARRAPSPHPRAPSLHPCRRRHRPWRIFRRCVSARAARAGLRASRARAVAGRVVPA